MGKRFTPIELSEQQRFRQGEIVGRLLRARHDLELLLDGPLRDVLAEYNDAVDAAKALASEVEQQTEDAIGERSDEWIDTSNGMAANEFSVAWSTFENGVERIDFKLPNHAESLSKLPARPAYVQRRKRRKGGGA